MCRPWPSSAIPASRSSPGAAWRRRRERPTPSSHAGTSSRTQRGAIPRCATRYRRSTTISAAARRASSRRSSPSTSAATRSSPRTWAWPRSERLTARSMTLPQRCMARATFVGLICLWTMAAHAQDTSAATAATQSPSWLMPDLAAAARAEGALTVYSSMNEQEGLPLWKLIEDADGGKVNYVRSPDSISPSRMAIESRGRQRSGDLAVTTTVTRLPNDALLQFDPPQARGLIAQARDPNRRWYGVYPNYNTPAYNTNLVKPSELPKSYEEFVDRKEWAGKIALDDTDDEWLSAMIIYYGEERGKKLLKDIAAVLKPVMVAGHVD